MRNPLLAILLSLLFLAAAVGCGKKAPPKPPDESAPSAVSTFTAAGDTETVILRWLAPDTTVDGEDLKDLAGFYVRRSIYLKDQEADFKELAEVKPRLDGAMEYEFRDQKVEPGKAYEYVIVPFDSDGAEGPNSRVLRVVFLGQTSKVEQL